MDQGDERHGNATCEAMTTATVAEIEALMEEVSDPLSHPTERAHARNKIIDAIPVLLKAAEQNERMRKLLEHVMFINVLDPRFPHENELRENIAKELGHD